MSDLTANVGQTITGTASYLDANGAATVPTAIPVWTTDAPDVFDPIAAADGLTASGAALSAGVANVHVDLTNPDGSTVALAGVVTVVAAGPGQPASGSVDFTAV